MLRALDLAIGGWGRVHPNPLVGAVVLSGDALVGEGYHAEFGGPHAERVAIQNAGDRARGGTLVVTLEPCAHRGKQPPCSQAIIEAGIRRVVIAGLDPNPVATGGVTALRESGVEVAVGLLAEEAGVLNAWFYHRFRQPDRPWVALKLATSVDYRIADHVGNSTWISGDTAREYVHWLRAGFDAIAVGAGTVRADDPRLTVRGVVEPRVAPARVVMMSSSDVAPGANLVRNTGNGRTILVTIGSEDAQPVSTDAGVHRISAPTLESSLRQLRSDGLETLLVEGGGVLAGSLLEANLVDRYYSIQSPLWLGSDGVPGAADLPSPPLREAHRWTVVERRALDQDTLCVMDRVPCLPD